VRAAVRSVGHRMLFLVRYDEMGELIYTHCLVITPYTLGRCALKNCTELWHIKNHLTTQMT